MMPWMEQADSIPPMADPHWVPPVPLSDPRNSMTSRVVAFETSLPTPDQVRVEGKSNFCGSFTSNSPSNLRTKRIPVLPVSKATAGRFWIQKQRALSYLPPTKIGIFLFHMNECPLQLIKVASAPCHISPSSLVWIVFLQGPNDLTAQGHWHWFWHAQITRTRGSHPKAVEQHPRSAPDWPAATLWFTQEDPHVYEKYPIINP